MGISKSMKKKKRHPWKKSIKFTERTLIIENRFYRIFNIIINANARLLIYEDLVRYFKVN